RQVTLWRSDKQVTVEVKKAISTLRRRRLRQLGFFVAGRRRLGLLSRGIGPGDDLAIHFHHPAHRPGGAPGLGYVIAFEVLDLCLHLDLQLVRRRKRPCYSDHSRLRFAPSGRTAPARPALQLRRSPDTRARWITT